MAMQDHAEAGHEMPTHVTVAVERLYVAPCGHGTAVAGQMAVRHRAPQLGNMMPLLVGVAASGQHQGCMRSRPRRSLSDVRIDQCGGEGGGKDEFGDHGDQLGEAVLRMQVGPPRMLARRWP